MLKNRLSVPDMLSDTHKSFINFNSSTLSEYDSNNDSWNAYKNSIRVNGEY